MKHESGWKKKSKTEIADLFEFSEGYKKFLDEAKTEREAVRAIQDILSVSGFSQDWVADKAYSINRARKSLYL